MHPTEVSVIIPAYNSADSLSRAIDCVLNQTFSSFEIIIGLSVCIFVFVKQFVVLSRRIQFLAPSAFIAFYGLFWEMKVVLVWAFLVGAADRIYRRWERRTLKNAN